MATQSGLFISGIFVDDICDVLAKEDVKKTAISPVSRLNREEEDDNFTVGNRLTLVWNIVEDQFAGEWDKWEGQEQGLRYSSKFTGEVFLYNFLEEGNDLKKCFLIGVESKKPKEDSKLFYSYPDNQKPGGVETLTNISKEKFVEFAEELRQLRCYGHMNVKSKYSNIIHSFKP